MIDRSYGKMLTRLFLIGFFVSSVLRADDLPAKAVPLFVKAEALAKQGKPNGAALVYKQIRGEYRTGAVYARATIALAALYYDRGQFQTAAGYYRELIRKFPDHAEAEAFRMDLASAEIEQGNHSRGFKMLLELARKQAVEGKRDVAYETLGQIDYSQLSRVPRQLAWELCGLVAQIAEMKKRYPAAVLALANQYAWITQENLKPWALNEIRSRVVKLQTVAEVDWVAVPSSRTSSPPIGPETTLPDLKNEEIRILLLERRRTARR